jgi:hypothetical protein
MPQGTSKSTRRINKTMSTNDLIELEDRRIQEAANELREDLERQLDSLYDEVEEVEEHVKEAIDRKITPRLEALEIICDDLDARLDALNLKVTALSLLVDSLIDRTNPQQEVAPDA